MLKEAVVADEDRNFYHHGGVDLRGTLARPLRRRPPQRPAPGRLDHHPAVREAGLHQPAAHPRPQGPRGHPGQPARPRSQQERDPLPLPDPRLLRRRQLRDRRGRRKLLPRPGQPAQRLAGGHPRRAHPGPERPGAPRKPRRRPKRPGSWFSKRCTSRAISARPSIEAALAQRLALDDGRRRPAAGATVVYPENSAPSTAYPDFVDYVTRWLLAHFPASEVYGGGLRVQTTLDPTVQADAYAAVRATLAGTSPPLDMAMAVVEPRPASCRPWSAGGASDRPRQVNLALGGCDPRPAAESHGRGGGHLLVRSEHHRRRRGAPAGLGVEAVHPRHRLRAGHPARHHRTRRRASTRSRAARCRPGSRPAPARSTTTNPAASSAPRPWPRPPSSPPTPSTPRSPPRSAATTWPPRPRSSGSTPPTTPLRPSSTARATPSASSTCPPSTWLPPTASSPTTASGPPPTPILEIVNGAGKVLVNNISPLPATTPVLPANVADNVTNVLQGVIAGGTGHRRPARPAGGRQDRHHQQLHQRLVRRLHADAVDRGVDGQRQQPGHPDGRRQGRRAGVRGDLAGDHLAGSS